MRPVKRILLSAYFKTILLFSTVCMCLYVWTHEWRCWRRLEMLEFPRTGITGSCKPSEVDDGNGTQVTCKSSKFSSPISPGQWMATLDFCPTWIGLIWWCEERTEEWQAEAAAKVWPSGRRCGGDSGSKSVAGEFHGDQRQRRLEMEMKEMAKGRGSRQRLQKVKDETLHIPLSPRVLGRWKALGAEDLISNAQEIKQCLILTNSSNSCY